MEQTTSSEPHRKGKGLGRNKSLATKPILAAAVLVVVACISFYVGVSYQKHHRSAASSNASGTQATGPGGFRGGRFNSNRVIGQVTAVSSTSISVQNRRTSSIDTLAITSSTQITDNGQTVTSSDIQVGATVLIAKDSSNASQAASISVNPSLGGFGGGSGSIPGATN